MSLPNEESENSKKRPRHYMRWGEPDEDEVPVPRRTLNRRIQQSQLPEAEELLVLNPQRNSHIPVCPSRLSPEHYEDNIVDATLPQEVIHGTQAYVEGRNCNFQSDGSDDDDGSLASTIPVSDSENGDLIYQIVISDDEYEQDECQERHFIPAADNFEDEQEPEEEHNNGNLTPGDNILQDQLLQETSAVSHQAATVIASKPAFHSSLKLINKLPSVVTSNVCLSPKEILLNLFNLSEAHDVNNSLFIGMCKLVNSMFSDPILPDTKFKLDELILSACGMKYHFYCSNSKCQKLLQFEDITKSVTCKCGSVNNVSDLTKASFFVTFDICTQLEILFRDPKLCALLRDPKVMKRLGVGTHDLCDGKVFQAFILSLDPEELAKIITCIICTDGSPLYKSSIVDIWPLLGTINELPPLQRMKKTILLGLWFGKGKPNFKLFLKPIRRSIINLSTNGAKINMGGETTFVKVDVIGCCVDAAVRGPIQGIHLHNGTYGCNWCLHPGELEGSGSTARKYRYLEASPGLRTHQQVVRDSKAVENLPPVAPSAPKPHINGVTGSSPLLKFPHFNIVDGIVLDSMHNFFLGTTRQFLRLWLGHEGNLKLPDSTYPGYYIGAPVTEEKINQRIALLVPPVELRRLPRLISELLHFKSRDLENVLLYFLVPVFKGILPDKYLRHFTLYVQGIYLLMKDEILPEDLHAADVLLDHFVKGIDKLYWNPNFSDFKQYSYNVHITLHAVENVRNWGPAWSVSGYPFENAIGDLKVFVNANRGIPDQIARAVCKSNLRDLLSQEVKSARCASFFNSISAQKGVNVTFIGNVKVFGLGEDFHPNEEEEYLLTQSSLEAKDFCVAKKIIYNDCVYAPRTKSTKTRNDFVQLSSGSIVQLKKMIVSECHDVVLVYYSVVHVTPFPVHLLPNLPISSPFMYNVDLIEQELYLISHNSLRKPCVHSDLRQLGGEETLTVIPYTMNRV